MAATLAAVPLTRIMDGSTGKGNMKGLAPACATALFVIAASTANAQAPWYNGDFNGFEYYVAGENIPTLGTYRNCENFVLSGSSYQISSIFGNFVTLRPDLRWSSVYWAVLKDVGNATKGSLIASGTSTSTQDFVGTVAGLSIWNSTVSLSLALAPGAYWARNVADLRPS
jgi:hypothetical protein